MLTAKNEPACAPDVHGRPAYSGIIMRYRSSGGPLSSADPGDSRGLRLGNWDTLARAFVFAAIVSNRLEAQKIASTTRLSSKSARLLRSGRLDVENSPRTLRRPKEPKALEFDRPWPRRRGCSLGRGCGGRCVPGIGQRRTRSRRRTTANGKVLRNVTNVTSRITNGIGQRALRRNTKGVHAEGADHDHEQSHRPALASGICSIKGAPHKI